MNRQELNNGCRLSLADESGTYHTYTIQDTLSIQGTTCLCYTALDEEGNEIILKEFYPLNFDLKRTGTVLDISSLDSTQIDSFIKGFENLKKASQIQGLEPFIGADSQNIHLLRGNGTLYYTNKKVSGDSLKDIAYNPDIFLDHILESFIGILDFLKLLHQEGLAYPDLKPEDILVRFDHRRNDYNYRHPLFYDFDSMVAFGDHKEVSHTYGPFLYDQESFMIDKKSENKTLANVLDLVTLHNKKRTINPVIKQRIEYLTDLLRDENDILSEYDVQMYIARIIEAICAERFYMDEIQFTKDLHMLKWFQGIACFLVSLIYISICLVLLSLFYIPDFVHRIITHFPDIRWVLAANILLMLAIIFLLSRIYVYNNRLNCESER